MTNDLPTMNSQPRTVTVNGKDYKVHPLDLEEMGELQEWIYSQQRRQVMMAVEEAVERNKLPIEVQKFMAMSALEVLARNRLMIGTPEADAIMASFDGIVYMAYLGIRKGDPNFKFEDTMPIARTILSETLGKSLQIQIMDAVDVIGADDPKSTAPDNGSPTSGAAPQSEWIGGSSTIRSSERRGAPGKKSPR